MPAPINTLLIDGSFEELSEELAQYIDDIRKKQGDDSANTKGEITPLLKSGQQDEVLKKLVVSSSALNAAPEKGEMTIPGFARDSPKSLIQNSLLHTTYWFTLSAPLPTWTNS